MKKIMLLIVAVVYQHFIFAQEDSVRPNRYFMIFSARDYHLKPFSIGGHAFVSWAVKGKGSDTLFSKRTLGFYPQANSNVFQAAFQVIEGHIMEGFDYNRKGMKLEQMIVEVDSLTWARSQKVEKGWARHHYNLLRSNCVSFIDRAARMSRLNSVKTTKWKYMPVRPVKYIRKMIQKNKKKVIENQYVIVESGRVRE
jgi:hypothetical protein